MSHLLDVDLGGVHVAAGDARSRWYLGIGSTHYGNVEHVYVL
jgi:hypothetical protein